jgi:hypothetical protein
MARSSKLTLLQQSQEVPPEEAPLEEATPQLEKLLTLDQVADLLSIGRDKKEQLIEMGLPTISFGERTVRVRPSAYVQWLLSREVIVTKG